MALEIETELELPPEADRLVTMVMCVDKDGNIHQSTQVHDNTWAEVYRGFMILHQELDRQIAAQRQCPFHPKTEAPWPSSEQR